MFNRMCTLARQYWLASLFGGLHLLLAASALLISLFDAWSDMNPTMVVAILFQAVDYPLFLMAEGAGNPFASSGSLALIGILGTIVWTLIGLVAQRLGRSAFDRHKLHA